MLQRFTSILNSSLQAVDGQIGVLDDLLFDDRAWTIRYLVVKTGGLLNRSRELISPRGVAELDWTQRSVKLNLTRKQIELSPDVSSDLPVFRQMEKRYFDYFQWPYYWDDMGISGIDPRNSLMIGNSSDRDQAPRSDGNPNLRSCRIVDHYAIESEGTRIGKVVDFIVDDKTWKIQHLLVDAKAWRPTQSVLIAAESVRSVNWVGRCIKVALTEKELESGPRGSHTFLN